MSECVSIDGGGYVVAVAETFPECSEFVLTTPAHLERLTFWADLSVALEPGVDSWPLYSAVLVLFATAWGLKQIARLILNR